MNANFYGLRNTKIYHEENEDFEELTQGAQKKQETRAGKRIQSFCHEFSRMTRINKRVFLKEF